MNTLEEQIYNYIATAEKPVTCIDITTMFGAGDERVIAEDEDRKYLLAWGMSESVKGALDVLFNKYEIFTVPCDDSILYRAGLTDEEMIKHCFVQDGFYCEELKEYLDEILPWAPLQILTFDQWVKHTRHVLSVDEAEKYITDVKMKRAEVQKNN
jgi:hypothetical protein